MAWFSKKDFLNKSDLAAWSGKFKQMMDNVSPGTDPTIKKIIENCPWEIFGRSSAYFSGAEKVLRSVLFGKNFKHALEIGTYHGITSALISKYVEKVTTLDIVNPGCSLNVKKRLWKNLGIKNIESFEIKNETEKENIISLLEFDFVYMDGDHAQYTYSDWMMVRKCGRVLFHEFWKRQIPVWNLVNSLPDNEVVFFHKTSFAYWEKKFLKI